MKKENQWSEKAKAPDPDDLTADQLPGKPRIDYTAIEHHEEMPDSSDTGDISRPQGKFWHRNERPGAQAIEHVSLDESRNEKRR